jgi:hypothetical protein
LLSMPMVRITISSNSPSWYFFINGIYSKCRYKNHATG